MFARHIPIVFTALIALAGLSACGSDQEPLNTPPASTTTRVVPSLGLVQNATVNIYAADGTTLLGTSDTGAEGQVDIAFSGYGGPILVEVLGDDVDAVYYDEASGTLQNFLAGSRMRALVAGPGGDVGVTPLTEVAYQTAVLEGAFPLTAAGVDIINEAIRAALAPGLASILSVPTVVDANTSANSLADTEPGRYALLLAALAELGSGQASPALAVLQALTADAADGVIDGQNGGGSVGAPYGDFINEMAAALSTAAGTYADASLQANASAQAPQSTTVSDGSAGGGSPNGTTQAATVNASLVSQYLLTTTANQSGSPFTDGQMVMVVVTGDGTLQIDDGPILSNPFVRDTGNGFNANEIIWLDAAADIEYALSNNSTGTFNEINVGDASAPVGNGVPAFLGQLIEQSSGGGGPANIELVQALAGTYTVTEVVEGTHDRGTVTIAADGALDYDTNRAFAVDDYDAIFDRRFLDEPAYFIETTSDGSGPRFDLLLDDSDNLIGVRYYPMGRGNGLDGHVEFGSTTPSDPGTATGDAPLGAGETGMSGVVDGIRTTIVSSNAYNDLGSGYFGVNLTDSNGPGGATRRWTMRAPLEEGSHPCNFANSERAFNTEISLHDGVNFFSASGDTGCTITVTSLSSDLLEATFSGNAVVFRDNMLQGVVIENGVVRLAAPQ